MDSENILQNKTRFTLTVCETLGFALFNSHLTQVGKKLLCAYASHKFTAKQNNGIFYKVLQMDNVSMTTDRRLSNFVIIKFEANFIPIGIQDKKTLIIEEQNDKIVEEKEYRRFVNENHPLLIDKLKGPFSDLSCLNFYSREIEILFNDYRLCINPKMNSYTVQYKKINRKVETFLSNILTREILYINNEGQIYNEPYFFILANQNIIGIGSFLECKNFAVKTVYIEHGPIKLYQRVCPDDYTQSYPFILEYEDISEINSNKYYYDYFKLGCRLDARVSKIGSYDALNHFFSPYSKPHHIIEEKEKCFGICNNNNNNYGFFKFDGVPCTLRFYRYHFVVYNSINSQSYEHCLPDDIFYILRDYSFLVESNLYESNRVQHFPKPQPMAIIDIHTTAFTAQERMNIITKLRKGIGKYLYDYYIFFQSEPCIGIHSLTINCEKIKEKLINNKIYEVLLDPITFKVRSVLKERIDKRMPNSRKLINIIRKLQQQRRTLNVLI